jgi:hypothetical protein
VRWAVLLLLFDSGLALAEPALGTERTIDAASGVTVAAARGPGLALGLRWFAADHFYMSGSLGASAAVDDDDPERVDVSTILGLGLGAGLYSSVGAWTGYAGGRVDVIKTLDQARAEDPTWFSSGIGAGPTLAIARRIGFAWGHPIGLELSAAYLVHRLRRAEIDPRALILYPAPDDIDGLEVGLHFTGTLFPDR